MIATSAPRMANAASHHADVGTSVESSAGSEASSDSDGASDDGWLSSSAVAVRVGDSAALSPGLSGERVDEGSAVTDGKTGVRDGFTEGPSPEPSPHDTRSRPAATIPTRPNRRDALGARSKVPLLPI